MTDLIDVNIIYITRSTNFITYKLARLINLLGDIFSVRLESFGVFYLSILLQQPILLILRLLNEVSRFFFKKKIKCDKS